MARCSTAAAALLVVAFAGPGKAVSEVKPSLDSFARNIIAAIGSDGRIDPAQFDCVTLIKAEDSPLLSCHDRAAGLGFLLIPGDGSGDAVDAISVTLVHQPGDDRGVNDEGELIVAEPADYAAIKAEFMAPGQTGVLAGLPLCPMTDPNFTTFAVTNPQSRTSMTFVLSPAGPPEQAWLDGGPAPEPGALLGTILVINQLGLSCAG